MSRLIVKNLPPYVTPAGLREHFEQKGCPTGTITDSKVALKADGTSRRFGFIGYKTENEAHAAKEWFDRTFVNSTRISVNVVKEANEAPIPRPNKRPRLGPSPQDPLPPGEASTSKGITNFSQLDDFLEVMKPRGKKGPAWANDVRQEDAAIATKAKPNLEPADDLETEVHIGDIPREVGLSDQEWMKQHMSKSIDVVERAFEQSDEEDAPLEDLAPPIAEYETSKDPTKTTILQTARLFVRNLAFSCTDADLMALFKPFGEISQVHIPLDSVTKEAKGVAYITFTQPSNAVAAYEALDRKSFQGRLLHILAAVDRKDKVQVGEKEGHKRTVKDAKLAKRKVMAGKEFNWSMLYMNSDAVASSIADRMNIDKGAILNPESGENAAVKLALAETHIIQETKSYLEAQGVLLSSFSTQGRSDTIILVKNIPYGTTTTQIREMFEPHGDLSKVIVPPAGTMAVVEFFKPDEALKAFRAVAYRRLGNSVVYLEKGPLGMFTETLVSDSSSITIDPTSAPYAVKIADQELDNDQVEEPSVTGGSTLYVKNLSFSTTQERLTQMFQHLPSFSFARVRTKPDPKRPEGPRLSMGYGFMGFKDVESAKKALKSMQGFVLDGHALHVKFAGRGTEEESKGKEFVKSRNRTPKMIVKNIPFEATKKDIRELFGSHGHLKSVRLPKKFDSRTRGFAFLEFVSRIEAENAYAALRHTHLLGRHLVLEWAEEAEQDLDVLRKKAGVGYGEGKAMPGRKRKLDFGKTGEEDVEDLEP